MKIQREREREVSGMSLVAWLGCHTLKGFLFNWEKEDRRKLSVNYLVDILYRVRHLSPPPVCNEMRGTGLYRWEISSAAGQQDHQLPCKSSEVRTVWDDAETWVRIARGWGHFLPFLDWSLSTQQTRARLSLTITMIAGGIFFNLMIDSSMTFKIHPTFVPSRPRHQSE